MMTGNEWEKNAMKNKEEKTKTAELVEWSREAEEGRGEGGEGRDNEYYIKNRRIKEKFRFNTFMICFVVP
jgi:hypothetical protein